MGFLEMRKELKAYLKEDVDNIDMVLCSAYAALIEVRAEKKEEENEDNSAEGQEV
jgi:ADP-dependent phosphofructokinase/glucokinase